MNRRQMLGATGAMLTLGPQIAMEAMAQAKAASGAMPVMLPPRLKAGDTVGLIEPASATWDPFAIALIEEALANLGLKSKRAHNILDRDGYFAGDDKARAGASTPCSPTRRWAPS